MINAALKLHYIFISLPFSKVGKEDGHSKMYIHQHTYNITHWIKMQKYCVLMYRH
jgi:hypothetical protein